MDANMEFEQPIKNPWEDKKSTVFKDWIFRNASKLPQEWDKNFQQYVDMRFDIWKKRVALKEKRTDEKIFDGYLRRMDIDEDDIKGKIILDLGCKEGSFVRTCLDRDLTQEIYGVDRKLQGEAASEKYSGHFFEGDFRTIMPVQYVDMILFKASFDMFLNNSGVEETVDTLSKPFDVLSPTGEIRIGPIIKRLDGRYPHDQIKIYQVLKRLAQSRNIEYEFIPVEIRAWERTDSVDSHVERVVDFDSVLVIRHAK